MGIKPDFLNQPNIAKDGCYMHYVLHSYQDGVFKGLNIDESIRRFIYREVVYKQVGNAVEAFDGAGKAVGIIFLHFDTVQQMDYFFDNHN